MWKKIKKLTDFALVAGFLGFIFLVPVKTFRAPVKKIVQETRLTRKSMGSLTKKFEGILEKNLYKKYAFINLNGRMAKSLGINFLNKAYKLTNGFITLSKDVTDIAERAENVIRLNKFLSDRNTPLIYLLAPSKNSMYDAQFAPGYGDDSKQNLTNLIDLLNEAGVMTINMDVWFGENGWHMEDVFFKTDHHWMPQAGLAAATCTMELLQKKGIAERDEEKLRDENYEIEILRNWWLGSEGKKVGLFYAGTDDIKLYQPKFKTSYSNAQLAGSNWVYRDDLLKTEGIKPRDYFKKSPYHNYMYGDNRLRITMNAEARNKKKLLIVGDSFKIVTEYFLTTQFQEIHTMDLRSYRESTFAQYFEEIKPDVVLMCINMGIDANAGIEGSKALYNNFGVDEYLAALDQTDPNSPPQFLGNFELQSEEENKNKFSVVCGNLEPNQAYTLTVDRTALTGAEHSFVQMTLQNLSKNKAIYNRYFESNSEARQKWIFTTPEKSEDAYAIYLYAGTKGHTAGIDVKVEGIRLRKGIFED